MRVVPVVALALLAVTSGAGAAKLEAATQGKRECFKKY